MIALPTPESQATTVTRRGAEHPVRRILTEDNLETFETVIEPEEVQANPNWLEKDQRGTHQPARLVGTEDHQTRFDSSPLCEGGTFCHRTTAATTH